MHLIDKITHAFERKEVALCTFLDLSKAFDTLDHSILLHKLSTYGIRGIPLEWFCNYLKLRKQFVSYSCTQSNFKFISCGVPQGSILGPLLFVIYVNDIHRINSVLTPLLYADDTTLFYSHRSPHVAIDKVVSDINKYASWFNVNKLSLNVKKTTSVFFTPSIHDWSLHPNVSIGDVNFNYSPSSKFLGVIMDCNLNWQLHIDCICNKLAKGTGILKRLRTHFPEHILMMLYNTLILPYISYCNVAWGGAYPSYIQKLFLLQKRAVRIITGSAFNAHTAPIFFQLRTLNIFDLHKYQIAITMFQYKYNKLPNVFDHFFSQNFYKTRGRNDYRIPRFRLTLSQHFLRYTGPKIWNDLPQEIKNASSITTFKSNLKKYFLSSYDSA